MVVDFCLFWDGWFIEKIGFWNLMLLKDSFDWVGFDLDWVKYWIGVGVKLMDWVVRFFNM